MKKNILHINLVFVTLLLSSCLVDSDFHEGVNYNFCNSSDTSLSEVFLVKKGESLQYYYFYSNGMIYSIVDTRSLKHRTLLFKDDGQKVSYKEFVNSPGCYKYYTLDSTCLWDLKANSFTFSYMGKEQLHADLDSLMRRDTTVHPGFYAIERKNDTLYVYGRNFDDDFVELGQFKLNE